MDRTNYFTPCTCAWGNHARTIIWNCSYNVQLLSTLNMLRGESSKVVGFSFWPSPWNWTLRGYLHLDLSGHSTVCLLIELPAGHPLLCPLTVHYSSGCGHIKPTVWKCCTLLLYAISAYVQCHAQGIIHIIRAIRLSPRNEGLTLVMYKTPSMVLLVTWPNDYGLMTKSLVWQPCTLVKCSDKLRMLH